MAFEAAERCSVVGSRSSAFVCEEKFWRLAVGHGFVKIFPLFRLDACLFARRHSLHS